MQKKVEVFYFDWENKNANVKKQLVAFSTGWSQIGNFDRSFGRGTFAAYLISKEREIEFACFTRKVQVTEGISIKVRSDITVYFIPLNYDYKLR